MGNTFGKLFRVTTFGESHGGVVGVIIDGCPPCLEISEIDIQNDDLVNKIEKINGVSSVFLGPGFITITKNESNEWGSITQEIINIFDKL